MNEAWKKQLEYDIFANQGGLSAGGQRYQGYDLMGQAANQIGGFNQISKKVAISEPEPDRTTISQAISRRVEHCEKEIARLNDEIKELSELRDALSSAKHFPVRVLRELIR